MNEREKYITEIESKLTSFNTTIEEVTTKAELRKMARPGVDFKRLRKMHDSASAKLKDLQTSKENDWENNKLKMDRMVGDIDRDLRKALTYFH
jgi:hypothetical protein